MRVVIYTDGDLQIDSLSVFHILEEGRQEFFESLLMATYTCGNKRKHGAVFHACLPSSLGEWSKTCRYCEGCATAYLAKLV